MAITYGRVTPRARSGTTGISTEQDIAAEEGCWISPPDRVAAVTVAVHIPYKKDSEGNDTTEKEAAEFVIETSCSRADTIGEDGTGGWWDNPFGDGVTLTEDTVVMIANAVTGVRVWCKSATSTVNVCFVG